MSVQWKELRSFGVIQEHLSRFHVKRWDKISDLGIIFFLLFHCNNGCIGGTIQPMYSHCESLGYDGTRAMDGRESSLKKIGLNIFGTRNLCSKEANFLK